MKLKPALLFILELTRKHTSRTFGFNSKLNYFQIDFRFSQMHCILGDHQITFKSLYIYMSNIFFSFKYSTLVL